MHDGLTHIQMQRQGNTLIHFYPSFSRIGDEGAVSLQCPRADISPQYD